MFPYFSESIKMQRNRNHLLRMILNHTFTHPRNDLKSIHFSGHLKFSNHSCDHCLFSIRKSYFSCLTSSHNPDVTVQSNSITFYSHSHWQSSKSA